MDITYSRQVGHCTVILYSTYKGFRWCGSGWIHSSNSSYHCWVVAVWFVFFPYHYYIVDGGFTDGSFCCSSSSTISTSCCHCVHHFHHGFNHFGICICCSILFWFPSSLRLQNYWWAHSCTCNRACRLNSVIYILVARICINCSFGNIHNHLLQWDQEDKAASMEEDPHWCFICHPRLSFQLSDTLR